MPSATTLNLDALNNSWIDFYSLLDLALDADEDAIRKRISVRYSEAIANYNHRDAKRRDYYQVLGQQVIPQCRRVLLNPEFREWYDCQNALHRNGDVSALDYKTFLTTLNEEGIATDDVAADAKSAIDEATPSTIIENVAAVQPPVQDAVEAAPVAATIEEPSPQTVEPVVPIVEPVSVATVQEVEPEPASDDKHYLTPTPLDEPLPVVPVAPGPSPAQKASLRPAAPTGPTSFIQDNLASPRSVQKAVKQATKAKVRKPAAESRPAYKPRVSVDNAIAVTSSGLFRHGERALSDTSIALLTAIVAAMLSITIDYFAIPGVAEWTGIGFAVMQAPKLTTFVPRPAHEHTNTKAHHEAKTHKKS